MDAELKIIEDRAHARNTLLSSDAMRHFIAKRPANLETLTFLDQVLDRARTAFPAEDGWVVLNLSRMQELCAEEMSSSEAVEEIEAELAATEVSLGAGSLAEAIVAGNVNAAYQMIEHRPMVALADAAADLDAIYRMKQGLPVHTHQVSELLKTTVQNMKLEELKAMIEALTSAIDGSYTDEQSAVKMAIMKAVSVVNKE